MKISSNQRSVSINQSDIRGEINRFLDMLWMERGLSDNTLYAYRNDLLTFARWLQQKGMSFNDVQDADIRVYLASIKGYSVRTLARRLSCLRQFYSYQVREGLMDHDPSVRVESPRLGRPLPKSLTETEVEQLLDAPDLNTDLGLRDRAMLEVLYATGLRVSAWACWTPPAWPRW